MPPPRVDTVNGGTQTSNSYQNIYSSSGFDLGQVLAHVVNRKNPTIEIGAVDMSCSFVVVDARKFDQPIVYASETFSRLTGYGNEEIVGRNCRFLQAPGDQTVVQGEKRRYTDGNAAHHLRRHIVEGQETQVSLINYHKGGKPFINLVTCVPIPVGDSPEIAFFVGFQVDLVDQPAAILDKMQNGSYVVNYSAVHATIARNPSVISFDPSYALDQLEEAAHQAQAHAAHASAKAGEAASLVQQARDQIRAMRRQFMRLLVDECDDFIHVLSLKGALLYVSGASRRLLEYEPNELLGKTLSSFCHPSDIVSVQRELKDAGVSTHPTVSLVYRIRRKNSGYVWFEAQGRLHLEPGKGRKCVILTGRPREVYKMSWRDLELAGGVGSSAHEFWAKVCVDGIFLAATAGAEKVLGVKNVVEDVIGKSIGDLSRKALDDAPRFMDALMEASRGNPSQVQHFMAPTPGAALVEVVTRFYPARSSTDSAQNTTAQSSATQPIGGKQVAIIAQALAAPSSTSDNVFDELNVTRGTSWQFELHQMRLTNKKLREEREALEALRKKKALLAKAPALSKAGPSQRACANCGRTQSAEWRSGPTGPKTLCNACGLRWSKAKSQANQAAKQRKEDEDKVMGVAPSSSALVASPSQSRSNSRDSSGSGSGGASRESSNSTNPTTVVPSPSPVASYGCYSGSPSAQPMAQSMSGYGNVYNCATSPLALYPSGPATAAPISRPGLVHQPSSSLQYGFPPPLPPHGAQVMPAYHGLDAPGPPPPPHGL
ncbi:uncharacterized protein RHOBADRAFT_14207 [Rhodotorula graminis WP1]|uniref:White collar 1 protein n=1 Tax=Rhodotorula graminis (strain WP1) TaxID=578459 RepID=A0A194S7T8_RHOGW|nr:uncharacterized protein RHOBADRAFT_14207 [Rhodotorula graminis WP1]KPV75471.1 hypothetical protein RHOBADRAFT_14207 [Rhodotorula graminis WP1]